MSTRTSCELIEQFGWVQGTYGSHAEGFCIEGALRYAYGVDFPRMLQRVMPFISPSGFRSAAMWNDAPGRTKDDVLAILRQVEVQP